ncbi:MAG: hypothetical protein OSJ61_13625, partial [Lachnospiraceae bacterium]|nr:hypothetical protein [Lachnospiraceae bacterium]
SYQKGAIFYQRHKLFYTTGKIYRLCVYYVTFYTNAKVVGIMHQNAKSLRFFTLAFCVQNLL